MKEITIAIHQPNFIPWLGYFDKMKNADIFVLLDDVEYTKNSFINRNKTLSKQGVQWTTIPVKYSGKSKQLIKDVEIVDQRNILKLLKTIKQNYIKTTGFESHFNTFSETIINASKSNKLSTINESLILWAKEILGVKTKLYKSSEMNIDIDLTATERIIAICKKLNATTYLSGKGGFNYQDEQLFIDNNIKLKPNKFTIKEYSQLSTEFVPGLSCLDYILNTK